MAHSTADSGTREDQDARQRDRVDDLANGPLLLTDRVAALRFDGLIAQYRELVTGVSAYFCHSHPRS